MLAGINKQKPVLHERNLAITTKSDFTVLWRNNVQNCGKGQH